MSIHLLYFAGLREALGVATEHLELPAGVATVAAHRAQVGPQLRSTVLPATVAFQSVTLNIATRTITLSTPSITVNGIGVGINELALTIPLPPIAIPLPINIPISF